MFIKNKNYYLIWFLCFSYQSVKKYIFANAHISFYFYSSPHFLFIISSPIRRLSPRFPSFTPQVPCIPFLIPSIPIISTVILLIPTIPLIPFPDSPFRLLQIAERFLHFALTT